MDDEIEKLRGVLGDIETSSKCIGADHYIPKDVKRARAILDALAAKLAALPPLPVLKTCGDCVSCHSEGWCMADQDGGLDVFIDAAPPPWCPRRSRDVVRSPRLDAPPLREIE